MPYTIHMNKKCKIQDLIEEQQIVSINLFSEMRSQPIEPYYNGYTKFSVQFTVTISTSLKIIHIYKENL